MNKEADNYLVINNEEIIEHGVLKKFVVPAL
jgi:hypothetical protein